jgi:hypothetical protein
MTCETARERVQEQIDGTLDSGLTRDLQRHLDLCAQCRGFAADLMAIADATDSLEPIDPPEHVWLQLAGQWRREQHTSPGAQSSTTRRGFSSFQWLAAAAVLTAAVGSGWIAYRATGDTGEPESTRADGVLLERAAVPASNTGNPPSEVLVESARNDLQAAEELYARAIAGLEQVADSQKAGLTQEVANVIDKNLDVLDQAIVQSRAAVQAQPASVEARESLFEALRKKVALLQNTIALVSEISRGNQAGASRLAGT